MPATNYTPIQLYRSTVSGNQPLAANMSAGEIALNIADNDMSIYMENASGTVKRFFNNPAALKYPTADGTSGQAIVTDGSGNLSFATVGGGALTNNTRQAVTSSATTTINLNSGNVIDLTMAANITTLSFTNVPASGTPILIQIVVKNAASGTAYTITWPNSVYWSGQYSATTVSTVQTAPTLATGANGVTVIALLTTNGGTNWRGWVEGTIPGGVINPSLYVWGYNLTGQLGLNDRAVDRSSPVQVGSLTNWASVSTGTTHCAAVKTDGTLWTWGAPDYGQLGLNDALVARSSPVQVGALTNWSLVSASSKHTVAIKTDGTMWSWGRNQQGQLGQNINFNINRSSPVQIGSGTTWSSVTSGPSQSLALKTDGTMWSWGQNAGYLGLNDTDNRSQPVQIGALTTWSKLSTGYLPFFAIKTDGTLWGWGANSAGELGDGTTVRKSSPVQIGALTTWAAVCMGAAIKTDGTLWTWGPNNSGQAMQNNTVDRSSPVQVGALTNWSTVVSGDSFKLALKTDGTLWAAGSNGNGRTGLNLNSISSSGTSSPTQVGALTTWIAVASIIEATSAGIIATPVNPA